MSEWYGLQTGYVKWFHPDKGFGFIAPDDGSHDLFVHRTEVLGGSQPALAEGQRVSFKTKSGPNGSVQCAGVEVIEPPQPARSFFARIFKR